MRLAREREWILVGFLIMKPSLTNFLMFWPAKRKPPNHLNKLGKITYSITGSHHIWSEKYIGCLPISINTIKISIMKISLQKWVKGIVFNDNKNELGILISPKFKLGYNQKQQWGPIKAPIFSLKRAELSILVHKGRQIWEWHKLHIYILKTNFWN